MTPAEIHRDAVEYLGAVIRAQHRMRARLATPLNGGERRLAEQALEALQSRYDTALAEMHAAADALQASKPACCQGTPVPHVASSRCQSGGRNHCTCDRCW